MLKKLPIGINTLSSIRDNDMVYVDKTPLIWQMVQQTARFFLSRPRRFGKSLLVDTLKELFEGNRALFEGLYIDDKWDWSKQYPVIKLDFASGVLQNRAQLDERIETLLTLNQQRLGIDGDRRFDLSGCFEDLILKAREKYGQKVVVLVDEYDKPILGNIDYPERAAEVREGLKNIYSVLKGQDAHLQFVFMTGVTKFSKVSLFSGLNQLKDITLDENYATICGYTQTDLETTFAGHLAGVDWAQLKTWYNGYQFLGEAVYNPYDILLFISCNRRYRNYWFETGNPSFLIKLFQQKAYFLPDLEQLEVSEEILDSFDVERINPVTLLFQTGYLTIKKAYTDVMGEQAFVLAVPNYEVKMALNNQLIEGYCQIDTEKKALRTELFTLLHKGDIDELKPMLQRLFSGIPWRNFTNNDLPNSEGYYASVLYAFFASLNAVIRPEDTTNQGQVDMTVELGDFIYVMEIKLDKKPNYQEQTPNPALQQIQDKDYAQKYRHQGKTVFEVGLIFNQQQRNLVQLDWRQLSKSR
ncbi:ATP-binding protein [Methylicorpusculum oleiharenae]|uniref:ATP-binding protein n=1 Tax=Methylicorpusculum oleiharenae TaxID=1338687 RepID=UPI001E4E2588|nr:ATP-binding protein [Methylicorpusculum oleiharenae]MCD2449104.1 ATP-binding protein [Methylicorpusculum oleiharenae]